MAGGPGAVSVTICGSGAAGHVLAARLSAHPGIAPCIFTQNAAKVRRWRATDGLAVLDEPSGITTFFPVAGNVPLTDDPELAASGCDLMVFVVPAFLHESYLTALLPHVPAGCVIAGLPGQSGFELQVRQLAGEVDRLAVMNFDSLPWVCQLVEFGSKVKVKGTKARLVGSAVGCRHRLRLPDPVGTLQSLVGGATRLEVYGHVLGITLRSPNGSNHPTMMYSRWKDWDGQPLYEKPMFYQGVDAEGCELLSKVSAEIVEIAERIMHLRPDVDLSQVVPQHEWELAYYRDDIADPSTLMSCLQTNAGYTGITHPTVQLAGGCYLPDYGHRFLTEDVPFGLAVIRGIAEIAGVATPHIDGVLTWAQAILGQRYLSDGVVGGDGIATSRCPQRYGIRTIDDLLPASPAFDPWVSELAFN